MGAPASIQAASACASGPALSPWNVLLCVPGIFLPLSSLVPRGQPKAAPAGPQQGRMMLCCASILLDTQ